jgi:hypothetical protein
LDVIFTIVSRNYAAQAATLMESLALAEPKVRRVIVATDGPIPALEAHAEVIDAASVGAPFAAMCVYYDALELNTAVKPYVFKHLLAQPEVTSVTYLDPDIYVYRPLDGVREGLAQAQLVLTPHVTRPLLGDANPNDQALLRSGVYNLGFCAVRAEPKVVELMSWWADRCRFDCRVDLVNGLFTDQKWMDLSPGLRGQRRHPPQPRHEPRLLEPRGPDLARGKAGWTVDGQPLTFFHFSGFDPASPEDPQQAPEPVSVPHGSPLADLLAEFAEAMLRNGHVTTSPIPYLHNRFARPARLAADAPPRPARGAGGEAFETGLSDETEAWFDAPDPGRRRAGPADLTRLMEQVWREKPATDPFDMTSREGRLAYHQWFVDNAQVLGADAQAVAAAEKLAKRAGGSARSAASDVWRDKALVRARGERFQLAARTRRRAAPRLPGAAGGARRPAPALRWRPGRPLGLVPGTRGRRRPVRGGPVAGRAPEVLAHNPARSSRRLNSRNAQPLPRTCSGG